MDEYEWKKTIYTTIALLVCIVGFIIALIKLG